jgi:starvation-inducible DNA-binding protein
MINTNTTDRLSEKRRALTAVRTDPSPAAVKDISGAMNATLADVFALYVKTKNFHWHVSGPHSAITTCCSMSTPINRSP